jgi:hypothetical protein
MSRLQRSCALVLAMLCAWTVSPAQAQTDSAPALPKHLFIAPCLRETVDAMMERSPTFRAQIEAIARTPGLGLAVTLEATPSSRRAEARMRRYVSGLLLANIRIYIVADKEELIAHEIEHVLEQVERVPVAELAKRGDEAWRAGTAYETRRAIRAGQRVANEMRISEGLSARAGRPSP